jgi:HD-like signal output (HDOD) protein
MIVSLKNDEPVMDEGSSPSIDDIVFEAGDLAALPQVILKLIDLTADPKVSAADVERVIQMDQGTTARVLTLANSSYYGLPRRISSVRDAVVFLGFKSVRSLAMQVTAFNMFLGKSDDASLARRNLWRHSLYAGLCTKVICKWLRPNEAKLVDAEEAFTAALLERAMPDKYARALAAAQESGLRFYQVERDFLPYSHAVIGSAMAERWSLPDSLCDTILNHHTPMDSQANPNLTAVVALANDISQGLNAPASKGEDEDDYEEVRSDIDAAAILRFTPETLQAVNEACKIEMEKGSALSSL